MPHTLNPYLLFHQSDLLKIVLLDRKRQGRKIEMEKETTRSSLSCRIGNDQSEWDSRETFLYGRARGKLVYQSLQWYYIIYNTETLGFCFCSCSSTRYRTAERSEPPCGWQSVISSTFTKLSKSMFDRFSFSGHIRRLIL